MSSPVRLRPNRRSVWVSCALGLLGLGVFSWAPRSDAGPSELLVIVNSQNPATRLTQSDLRPIFQTSKRKWDSGALVEPVNLPEKSPPRQMFDKAVLGFDPEKIQLKWE